MTSLSLFLIRRLIFVLIQGCLSLDFAVLCGIYLNIALASSEVMFSHSWFTGVNLSIFCFKMFPKSLMCLLIPSQLSFL